MSQTVLEPGRQKEGNRPRQLPKDGNGTKMNWEEKNGKLVKRFEGKSFSDICKKLNQLAPIADEMDHHPDFEVSGYKHIRFTLFTHSENQITELDYQLAEKVDSLFG